MGKELTETEQLELEPEPEAGAPELDDDGNPVEPEPAAEEPWQQQEDELADVPVSTHIRMKTKLKGRLANEKDRVAQLEAEVEALKSGTNQPTPAATNEMPVLPKRADFADDAEFDVAYDKYRDDKDTWNQNRNNFQAEQVNRQQTFTKQITEATESHYDRAAKLVTETGISPEAWQKTDTVVREAVEAVLPKPGMGDIAVDQFISVLGEGSEKVLYYIGRNPGPLTTLKGLLAEDPSGMKAVAYLGQQKERLSGIKKRKSNAPAPAPTALGDESSSAKGRALKKKYDAAFSSGKIQEAYDIRKKAKITKIDTKDWAA